MKKLGIICSGKQLTRHIFCLYQIRHIIHFKLKEEFSIIFDIGFKSLIIKEIYKRNECI